jgi:hypothetical protein
MLNYDLGSVQAKKMAENVVQPTQILFMHPSSPHPLYTPLSNLIHVYSSRADPLHSARLLCRKWLYRTSILEIARLRVGQDVHIIPMLSLYAFIKCKADPVLTQQESSSYLCGFQHAKMFEVRVYDSLIAGLFSPLLDHIDFALAYTFSLLAARDTYSLSVLV